MGDGVADTQPDDPDPQPAEAGLLGRGDLQPVPVDPQRPIAARPDHPDQRLAPWVVGGAGLFAQELVVDRGDELGQLGSLDRHVVEHRGRAALQLLDDRPVGPLSGVEDDGAPAGDRGAVDLGGGGRCGQPPALAS